MWMPMTREMHMRPSCVLCLIQVDVARMKMRHHNSLQQKLNGQQIHKDNSHRSTPQCQVYELTPLETRSSLTGGAATSPKISVFPDDSATKTMADPWPVAMASK